MFITIHNAAIVAAVNYLTNKDSIQELEALFNKKLGKMPAYFDVVFKVSGYERTAYTITIQYYNIIDADHLPVW